MRTGMRVAAMGGIAAMVAAGTAACGSGGGSHGSHAGASHPAAAGSSGAVHAVQAAYTTSTSEKTAAFHLNEAIRAKSPSGSAQNVTITGAGQVDFATHSFGASVNAPSGGAIKVLQTGGIEYVQVPAAARNQIPGHKPWVSVNLNKVSQAKLGASFSQLASAGNDNPARALSQLSAVSSHVTKAGTATIAGVPATEYKAQVSLNKEAAQAQAKAGPKAAQAIRQEEKALGTATLPVDVWVDAHHLIRQIRVQVPIPAASTGASGKGTATATITFTQYGAPVHLTPPPASQTADITPYVLQQAKGSNG